MEQAGQAKAKATPDQRAQTTQQSEKSARRTQILTPTPFPLFYDVHALHIHGIFNINFKLAASPINGIISI